MKAPYGVASPAQPFEALPVLRDMPCADQGADQKPQVRAIHVMTCIKATHISTAMRRALKMLLQSSASMHKSISAATRIVHYTCDSVLITAASSLPPLLLQPCWRQNPQAYNHPAKRLPRVVCALSYCYITHALVPH
eukprot:GHRQ01015415.1.p1 GENE.GHRQ01015415.1~~GHRQ01015415.1.p1  ORF type:complete len:137 (-),score=3.17 GHRQ01015415.1:298-708(-)